MNQIIKPESIIENIHLYRKKYLEIERQLELFGMSDNWHEVQRYLTDKRIQLAISGKRPAGYFSTTVTNTLSLDIDDHIHGGWISDRPTKELEYKYNVVKSELTTPSALNRSPRGLHAYYFLTMRLPSQITTQLAKEKIGKVAEVRPTVNTGLRLPVSSQFIHPELLTPVTEIEIVYKNPIELFDNKFTIEYQRAKTKDFPPSRLRLHTNSISNLEMKYMPYKGNTNTPLCVLGLIYRGAGLTLDEASQRFTLLLKAANYTGELTNYHRLRQRMSSVFRANIEITTKDRDIEPSLWDAMLIEAILRGAPFVKQRIKPLRRFIEGILNWCNYQDDILNNPAELAVWDYLYKNYRFNRLQGLYPLPASLLRKLNFRYFEFLPYLEKTAFLQPSHFNYSTRLGICKHFFVERNPEGLNLE